MDRIPVYLNNFNRLTTLAGMVTYLRHIPKARPIVVDNASTYPPLLDWYTACDVEVIRLGVNAGPCAPWDQGCIDQLAEYYAVSDSDLDLTGIPRDLLDVLVYGLKKYPGSVKVGLSLEINDLRQDHPMQRQAIELERNYWSVRVDDQFWDAPIDTTFAIYRQGSGFGDYRPALRSDRPYTARHLPYYRSAAEWDDEERYYAAHLIGSGQPSSG